MYRTLFLLASFVSIATSFSSCTVLQYRETDQEIQAQFKVRQIESKIQYMDFDSIGYSIRVLQVASLESRKNLIFLHGSPSSLTAWRQYMWNDSLAQEANLYAIDRPGYGYSNFGKQMPSIDKQAQIVSAIIDRLELDNVVTIGTSYGAPLAARTAVINNKVKGVVMVSAAIDPKIEKDFWVSRLTQWKLTRWLVPTGYRVAGDEKTVHAAELERIKKDWSRLQIPILHLHGGVDDIVPWENIRFTDSAFAKAKTKLYKEINHDLAWEHPEILIPEILEFISKIED